MQTNYKILILLK